MKSCSLFCLLLIFSVKKMGRMWKEILLQTEACFSSQRKVLAWLFALWVELPACSMEHHFHLREQLSDKNYSDSVVCIWQTFSIINEVRLSLPEKPLKSFCWLIKTGAFKWKSQLGKPASATVSLTASCFKDPSVKISADMNKWENEMRQYSEEPQSSMGQHFLHTRRMSRNPAGEKGLLRARQTTEC